MLDDGGSARSISVRPSINNAFDGITKCKNFSPESFVMAVVHVLPFLISDVLLFWMWSARVFSTSMSIPHYPLLVALKSVEDCILISALAKNFSSETSIIMSLIKFKLRGFVDFLFRTNIDADSAKA